MPITEITVVITDVIAEITLPLQPFTSTPTWFTIKHFLNTNVYFIY